MSSKRIYVSEFRNCYGELWRLQINTQSRVGILAGDELGRGKVVRIVDGYLGGGLILSPDELGWLRRTWKEATGDELKLSAGMAAFGLLQGGDSVEALAWLQQRIEPSAN